MTSTSTSRRSSTRSASCRPRTRWCGGRRVRRGPGRRRRHLRRGAFAPEQHIEAGLTLDEVVESVLEGVRLGSAGRSITIGTLATAMRRGQLRARSPSWPCATATIGRGRLRHRRQRGGQPADPAPGGLPGDRQGQPPSPSTPARRSACPRSGRRAAVRRRAAGPRRAHRRGHHLRRRRPRPARPAGRLRARPPGGARDVPHLERRTPARPTRSPSTPSACSPACATGSRSTPTTGSCPTSP